MRLPFLNRFIIKHGIFEEMEEITDKTLREFLRNPWDEAVRRTLDPDVFADQVAERIGNSIYGDKDKIRQVTQRFDQIPVFCTVAGLAAKGMDAETIHGETGVCLPYIVTLQEIAERQTLAG